MEDQSISSNKVLTRRTSASSLQNLRNGTVSTINRSEPTSHMVKDYTLDKRKALDKKSDACKREHMKSQMKPGRNLVIQFSTAAYEYARSFLEKLLYDEKFPFSVEKRESLEQNDLTVDICYKILNTKADGSCGKIQKFVINCYHTTSQLLINGCKIDIYLNELHERLCNEMKRKYTMLDFLNINIAQSISSAEIKNDSVLVNKIKAIELLNQKDSDEHVKIDSRDNDSECEISELRPICQKQADGKTVQCGTCGEWYHYDCLEIDHSAILTLGEDDYTCRLCSEDLMYNTTERDTNTQVNQIDESCDGQLLSENQTDNENEKVDSDAAIDRLTGTLDITVSPNTGRKTVYTPENIRNNEIDFIKYDSPKRHLISKDTDPNCITSIGMSPPEITLNKTVKPIKKSSKAQKLKKDEVMDKTYILDLENQVNQLKSTLEVYRKAASQNEQKSVKSDERDQVPANENHPGKSCDHKCYGYLSEKLQENRIRLLETQMMQNLYINNAMHIQLVAQLRSNQPVVFNSPADIMNNAF